MLISSTDIAIFIELSLASGRVAYSVTQDDIFRPVREFVYKRSAPDSDTILVRDENGDHEYPARSFHYGDLSGQGVFYPWNEGDAEVWNVGWHYRPELPPREPGWAGCLIECPYCLSFWTSLIAGLAWLLLGDAVAVIAAPLAIWALANTYAVKGL